MIPDYEYEEKLEIHDGILKMEGDQNPKNTRRKTFELQYLFIVDSYIY